MRGRGVESAEGTLFWTVQLNLSVSAGIMTLSLCFHMEQDISTILSRSYDEYFGFNQQESDRMLQDYNLEAKSAVTES